MDVRAIKGVYNPRKPRSSPLFALLDKYWDRFVRSYGEVFECKFGPMRRIVEQTGDKFLKCGILDFGFARIRCPDCGDEFLVGYSCKCRNFCPSCSRKRQLIFADHLKNEVLQPVMHRHVTFSLPKRIRYYFYRHRKLLPQLSRMAYQTLQEVLKAELGAPNAIGAAVSYVQTFGGFLVFNPHAHAIVAWGLFDRDDSTFYGAPRLDDHVLEMLFRKKVFAFLLKRGIIDEGVVENMLSWHHSGFNVHCGPLINVMESERMEKLAGYIARGPVALSRLDFDEQSPSMADEQLVETANLSFDESRGQVVYRTPRSHATGCEETRSWDPLSFIRALCDHIPEKGQKLCNYYGFYSNKCRGQRKKSLGKAAGGGLTIKEVREEESSHSKAYWAKFIKKVYEVDPLICKKCGGKMYFVSFIELPDLIFKILKHLDLLGKDPSWGSGLDPPGLSVGMG